MDIQLQIEPDFEFMEDRGLHPAIRILHREVYRVTQDDGKSIIATVIYRTHIIAHVWQTGNARWPDNRRCNIRCHDKRLLRDIPATTADGVHSNAGHAEWSLPGPGEQQTINNNCNACFDEGRINQWQQDRLDSFAAHERLIRADLVGVRALLDAIGKVEPVP